MGMVNITIQGSFGRPVNKTFSAEEGGHALAITRAIQTLIEELPNAIRVDHRLARMNEVPPKSDFGEVPR